MHFRNTQSKILLIERQVMWEDEDNSNRKPSGSSDGNTFLMVNHCITQIIEKIKLSDPLYSSKTRF